MKLTGKKVLVFGAGISGIARRICCARYRRYR